MPLYKVERTGQKPRLVEAPNPAAARQHVARSELTVTMVKASEALTFGSEGIKLEIAGETPSPAPGEQPKEPSGIGSAGAAGNAEAERQSREPGKTE